MTVAEHPPQTENKETGQQPPEKKPRNPREDKPVETLPLGLVSLSAIGRKRTDEYATLREHIGERLIFQDVRLSDDGKSGAATVFVYDGEHVEAGEDTKIFEIVLPKASLKMMRKAITEGFEGVLSARVEATARGVALR